MVFSILIYLSQLISVEIDRILSVFIYLKVDLLLLYLL